MNRIYKIINVIVSVDEILCRYDGMPGFLLENEEKVDCYIKGVNKNRTIHEVDLFKPECNYTKVFRFNDDIMFADDLLKNCEILCPYNSIENVAVFILQAFYSHAVQKNIIQFHGALIEWKEQGILFLGPSGIGKTTQAELWEQYLDAEIINGDMVFVEKAMTGYLGWGTPWHGSSPYCVNKSVSIKMIVVLKQKPINRLRELNGFEKVSEVSNSVFYPMWVENGMDLCLEILNQLLLDLPVYCLENCADENSVKLLLEELEHIG